MAMQWWRKWFKFLRDEAGAEAVLPVFPSVAADPDDPPTGSMWRNSALAASRQIRYFDGTTVRDLEVRTEKDQPGGYVGIDEDGVASVSVMPASSSLAGTFLHMGA